MIESRMRIGIGLAALVSLALSAQATRADECIVTSADPATLNEFDLPWSFKENVPQTSHYYAEERNSPVRGEPPVPGSGTLPGGGGTFVYEESNGLPGMQRDCVEVCAGCVPDSQGAPCGDDACFPPVGCTGIKPPVYVKADWAKDETCGAGPDFLILGGLYTQ